MFAALKLDIFSFYQQSYYNIYFIMTLKEYYQNLKQENPAIQFRDQVLEECCVSYDTFYKWLNTETQPNRLTQQKIAEISGISIEKLFPVKQLKDNSPEHQLVKS